MARIAVFPHADGRPFTGRNPSLSAQVPEAIACGPLPCGKGLAAHHGVDGVEDGQASNIRHAANGDRIGEILDLAVSVDERRPHGKTWAVWIARLGEIHPVAGYLTGQFPISRGPVPGRLIKVVEDIPELGEVAR